MGGIAQGQAARQHEDALALQLHEQAMREQAVQRQQQQEEAARQAYLGQIDTFRPAPAQWMDPPPAGAGEQGPPAPVLNPDWVQHQTWRQSIQGAPSHVLGQIAQDYQQVERQQKMAQFNEDIKDRGIQRLFQLVQGANEGYGYTEAHSPIIAAGKWILHRLGINTPLRTDRHLDMAKVAALAHRYNIPLDQIMPPDPNDIASAQHGDTGAISRLSTTPGGQAAMRFAQQQATFNPADLQAAIQGDAAATSRLVQTPAGKAALLDARRAAAHQKPTFSPEAIKRAFPHLSDDEAAGYAEISTQSGRLVKPPTPKGGTVSAEDARQEAADMLAAAGIENPESSPVFMVLAHNIRVGGKIDDKMLDKVLGSSEAGDKMRVSILSRQANKADDRLRAAESAVARFRSRPENSKLDKDGTPKVALPAELQRALTQANTDHVEAGKALEDAMARMNTRGAASRQAPAAVAPAAPAAAGPSGTMQLNPDLMDQIVHEMPGGTPEEWSAEYRRRSEHP